MVGRIARFSHDMLAARGFPGGELPFPSNRNGFVPCWACRENLQTALHFAPIVTPGIFNLLFFNN
jgi:hypothetical protein